MTKNPLSSYFRHPELYIALPSGGRWWPEGSIDVPENNEFPIYPMTGQDDLSMKNADGLMNGDTTVRVIQSCCPHIKNAWHTPSIDVDSIMIAMRIASYGYRLDAETNCSKCKAPIGYAADLRAVMSNIKLPNYDDPIEVGDLTIFMRPAPYRVVNLNNTESYQQQRAIMQLKDQSLPEEKKVEIIRAAIERLTNISISRLSEFIDRIVLPDGNAVTDKKFISEFIENADRDTFNTLRERIADKAAEYKLPRLPIKCDECGHEDEREFQFDPASFFATSS